MPRDLVNVVLDRVNDQTDLVERALADAGPSVKRLQAALRVVIGAPGTVEQKRQAWRRAFALLVLAESAKALPDAVALARRSLAKEVGLVRSLGTAKVRQIPALRKPDLMRRRAEREVEDGGEKANG